MRRCDALVVGSNLLVYLDLTALPSRGSQHSRTFIGNPLNYVHLTIVHLNIQFVPHRKHITSPLQSPTG
jgi:hypothetical protein